VVKERFAEASVLFAIDQLIKGVVRAIAGLVRGILTILPIPGVQQLGGILSAFLKIAVGFIDEVILAYAIRTQSDNAWMSAKEALVLYGQNSKVMLKNAAWLAIIVYGLSFLVFIVMLAPAALVVYLMPGAWAAGGRRLCAPLRLERQGRAAGAFRHRLHDAGLFQDDRRPGAQPRVGRQAGADVGQVPQAERAGLRGGE
jgi:hypothetical protein